MVDADALDWDDLRYFLLAAQAGTLAGAARSAGVQHTTIGRRLTALERSLGAPLFLRGPEGLSLTPLGEQLLPLVRSVERSVGAVHELARSRRARVRVALPAGFFAVLGEALAGFGRRHAGIALDTTAGGQLLDLKRGEADLALRIGPIHDDELIARRLGEVGWSLYASPRYLEGRPPLADAGDLAEQQVIAYGPALASTPAARWLDAHAAGARVALSTDEIATMLEAAVSGVGLALLPCLVADPEPRLVRLTPRVLARRELSLVYRRETRTNDAVRMTANFLVRAVREHADRIGGARPPSA